MLTAVGFHYDKLTNCWVHPGEGRLISAQAVAAHDTDWLAHWITNG